MKNPVYFVKDQIVYEKDLGEGVVVNDKYSKDHPIAVKFKNTSTFICYTFDGRSGSNREIVLSQTPIPPIVNKPIYLFKEGDLVMGYNLNMSNWVLGKFVRMIGANKDRFLIKINNIDWEYHQCIPYGEIPKGY